MEAPDSWGMLDDDFPTCRATIRDGTVTLNPWRPAMGSRGPLKAGYVHVDVPLADLHRCGGADDEVVVAPVRGVPWSEEAAEALVSWAGQVGYRRVWLPDRVVELDVLAETGWAAVTCPACGARWEDGGAGFWSRVRSQGWFPADCLACGGSLPEWQPCQAAVRAPDSPSRTPSPGGTPCT